VTTSTLTTEKGSFEPFGQDYSSAQDNGVFLRFPGQRDDASWSGSSVEGGYYNAFRWYQHETGGYSRPDPLLIRRGVRPLLYAGANPLAFVDPLGLVEFSLNVQEEPGSFYATYKNCPHGFGALNYACTKVDVNLGCTCVCAGDGKFKPSISIRVDLTGFYPTDLGGVGSPEFSLGEEYKHVLFNTVLAIGARLEAERLEKKRYGSKTVCYAACGLFVAKYFGAFGLSGGAVHQAWPHPW
jgi:RHS repeat-associated protein